MSDYHINVFCSDEDRGYIADIPDLETCSAFGATSEEALAEGRACEGSVACGCARGRTLNSGRALPARHLRHLTRFARVRDRAARRRTRERAQTLADGLPLPLVAEVDRAGRRR